MGARRLTPLLVILILAGARPAIGHDAVAEFGPREFVRADGHPTTLIERFAICGPERAFRLRVVDGPGRRHRVSAGTIRLNGVEIVGPRDFRHHDTIIERHVALQAENTLAVRLVGRPGSAVAVSIHARTACFVTAFTAPAPGAVVPPGPLLVEGTVRGPSEIGVVVNGVPAAVQGDRFAALVSVDSEVTELVAVATRPDGRTREARLPLTVTAAAPERPVVLRVMPPGGAAPVPVRFSLLARVPVAELRLDLGDGRSVTNPVLETESFTYAQPGLYVPTVTVIDPGGAAYTAAALVAVVDRAAFDVQLRARWTAMKDALRAGRVARALEAIATQSRDAYLEMFANLTIPLSRIDDVLTDIELVDADEFQAEYRMLRVENGQALSHFVRFVRDTDGLWRLAFF
jgi:hypothetical protein